MKKITSAVLIALLTLTVVASSVDGSEQSIMLTDTEMSITQGGLRWACIGAIAAMGVATAGMVMSAGAIGGFLVAFAGLGFTTWGLVDACA